MTKLEKCVEQRGIILCVLLTIPKVGIGIPQLSWETLDEKGYHIRSSLTFRENGVGNGSWHCIVCQNKAIFGMYLGPGMGSKAPGADFQSDPRAMVFSFSGFRNSFFLWNSYRVVPRSDRRPHTHHLSHSIRGRLHSGKLANTQLFMCTLPYHYSAWRFWIYSAKHSLRS
jgi:hypothetical protein